MCYQKIIRRAPLLLFFFAVAPPFLAAGQTPFKAVSGSEIKVTGSSSLHGWSMNAQNFTCEADLDIRDGRLQGIRSLKFELPVKNLKAREEAMNSRAYKALNVAEYPTIVFALSAASVSLDKKSVQARGYLTISGEKREVAVTVSYQPGVEGVIAFRGTKEIRMSDFKIKPPSFMAGTLKTGDAVTVTIFLKMKPSGSFARNQATGNVEPITIGHEN